MSSASPEAAQPGTVPALVTSVQANTNPLQTMISFSRVGDLWIDYPASQAPAKEMYIALGGSGIINVPQGTSVFRSAGGPGYYLVYVLNDANQALQLSWGYL